MSSSEMTLARLLGDKQDELDAARDRWARCARSLTRQLVDGAVALDQFDLAAFGAAVEDLRDATNVVRPLVAEVRELKARIM